MLERSPPPLSRAGKVLLSAALVGLLIVRGILPAFHAISDDFPEYFTSAKSVRDGEDAVKLYDGDWFRQQTHRYRVGSAQNPGEFTPYPPPTALLLTPLTGFRPLTALRIVTVFNVICLVGSVLLLSRIFSWRLLDCALFILLSGWALHTGLRFGHPYILISTLCLLGYYLAIRGMPWLAGLCFGVLAPIKYYPAIILAGFAVNRLWRVVFAGAAAASAVAAISIATLGWPVHRIFIHEVILNHLTGHLIPGPRFLATFQSFDTLFERLFIADPARNPHPWFSSPPTATIATVVTKLSLVLAAAVTMVKLRRDAGPRALAPAIGILGILILLIAPGSGTYAFVLLWLPVAGLIDYFLAAGIRVSAYLMLAGYAFIGFIPYGMAYRFEGDGALNILAYPRLLALLVMFSVCLYAVLSPHRLGRRAMCEPGRPELQNA